MLIDWPTVIFQIVNFLVLVALLKRFLYGPIINAMDEREAKIAKSLAEAARIEKKAEEQAHLLALEQEEFAKGRMLMRQEARLDIDKWKKQSIERLQEEIAARKEEWRKNLEEEQEAFLDKLKISIGRQVFQVAKKAFSDLADARLENKLFDTFLGKLDKELTGVDRQELKEETLQLISGFPLSEKEKEYLRNKLKALFHGHCEVKFRQEPDLGLGIRLMNGNQKWEWNLSRYMREFEDSILQVMKIKK